MAAARPKGKGKGHRGGLQREDFSYTAKFCEENVYLLCQAFLREKAQAAAAGEGDEEKEEEAYAVVVSSPSRETYVWCQRAGNPRDAEAPVVWDYHVFFLRGCGRAATDKRVLDLDTTLNFPVPAYEYFHKAFRPFHLPPEMHQCFRVVRAQDFVDYFASDRSHMRVHVQGADQWMAPPPTHAPIRGPRASQVMNLDDYLDVDPLRVRDDEPEYMGVVMNLEQFGWFCSALDVQATAAALARETASDDADALDDTGDVAGAGARPGNGDEV